MVLSWVSQVFFLTRCSRNVKELVGELDFSYHIISTADSSTSTSTDNLFNPMKSNPTSTVTNGKEIKND